MTYQCPDQGACHHDCLARGESCFRVNFASPLSGVYPDNQWPDSVKAANRPIEPPEVNWQYHRADALPPRADDWPILVMPDSGHLLIERGAGTWLNVVTRASTRASTYANPADEDIVYSRNHPQPISCQECDGWHEHTLSCHAAPASEKLAEMYGDTTMGQVEYRAALETLATEVQQVRKANARLQQLLEDARQERDEARVEAKLLPRLTETIRVLREQADEHAAAHAVTVQERDEARADLRKARQEGYVAKLTEDNTRLQDEAVGVKRERDEALGRHARTVTERDDALANLAATRASYANQEKRITRQAETIIDQQTDLDRTQRDRDGAHAALASIRDVAANYLEPPF